MLERERLQPRYRGLAHTVGPREIGLRSAFRESLDSLLPLVAGQSRRAPKTHATGLGTDTAGLLRPRRDRALSGSDAVEKLSN